MGQLHSTMVGVTTPDEQLEPDYPHICASCAFLFPSVWTGSELIVWGGIVNTAWPFVSTNTGGRYNPATNSWTSTTMQSAPSARDLQQAVWTGSQMIVCGVAPWTPTG